MTEHRISLPEYAKTFLSSATRVHTERVIVMFHRWLLERCMELSAVTGKELQDFLDRPSGKAVKPRTANSYRWELRLYLRWLAERGLAGPFEKQELEGYHRKHLPDEVRQFLRHLAPTRKPSTVNGYKATLRRFHEWLAEQRIELAAVDRETCLGWGQLLHEKGLHPATRVGMMVCVRKYVDWLWEGGVTAAPGRELIRGSDLPTKPEYLPRPLPADSDRELQQKLKDDESKVSLGLYVMRRTGLRIGELRRLERDCVRVDHNGSHFLKVPLGKMNNERLVPLDPTTLSAIVDLQGQAKDQQSQWLIEGARERPVSIATFQSRLVHVAGDMPFAEPLTTHRLRHRFATSLMNGGMSLTGIMKLLSHRDQRMTLRYTQIADETVGREYFEALSRVTERYATIGAATAQEIVTDPLHLLQDVIRWLGKELCVGRTEHHARLLIRRLERAADDLSALQREAAKA